MFASMTMLKFLSAKLISSGNLPLEGCKESERLYGISLYLIMSLCLHDPSLSHHKNQR